MRYETGNDESFHQTSTENTAGTLGNKVYHAINLFCVVVSAYFDKNSNSIFQKNEEEREPLRHGYRQRIREREEKELI